MRFGFGVLRLAPTDFWTMTPRELAAAMGAHRRPDAPAPGRDALMALMAAYPDRA
jgi:uncharacterized phage protein (TIGR02216 family)